jgi:uncharacterized protein (DUF488 family)
MNESLAPDRRRIFTIGHSNHALEIFLDLLRQHGVEVLVDVRSQPYSRYTPHFTATALKSAVLEAGLRYLYLGKELGGRPDPDNDAFYNPEGHVYYNRVAEWSCFQEGIERVLTGIARYRVALLCAEEDPIDCHRHLLIGWVLQDRHDVEVLHIRGDGSVQAERELREAEERKYEGVQQTLFNIPSVDEDAVRLSRRPVRPQRI